MLEKARAFVLTHVYWRMISYLKYREITKLLPLNAKMQKNQQCWENYNKTRKAVPLIVSGQKAVSQTEKEHTNTA